MLAPEDENEAEVRREDQENINRFARVNARLSHVREQKEERKKKEIEKLDDATTELMMGMGDKVMISIGDAFLDVSEDEATSQCENQTELLQKQLDQLQEEEGELSKEKEALKQTLYARFGKSINLEDS